MQYTIRGIPPAVNDALRERARSAGKSLNEAAIDALTKGLGLAEDRPRFHDLDLLAGTWQEDAAFDAAIAAQDQVDPRLWK